MVAGDLAIRDSDPTALAQPTIIGGTVDDQTGAMVITSFDTPTISFERPVTGIITATARIDAEFTPVGPGTGSVDADGNVVLNQALTVDLHIEVVPVGTNAPLTLPGDCTATPVDLELRSGEGAPHDPADGGSVVLTDANFTVPEIPATARCTSLISEEINEALAGPGHSISLDMTGALTRPPAAPCQTTTAMVADPAGSSELGAPVGLTATVAAVGTDQDCVDAATAGEELAGDVDFFSDGGFIGSAPLDAGGGAILATSDLRAGDQDLSARFRGAGSFDRSTSAAVAHRVTAPPAVTSTLPSFIEIGSGSHEFDVTFHPNAFSVPTEQARLDLTVTRGLGTLIVPSMLTVEAFVDDAWEAATLTAAGGLSVVGSLAQVDADAASPTTVRLRASFGAPNPGSPVPGGVILTFEVVPGDAALVPAPAPVAWSRGGATTTLVAATRAATTLTLGVLGQPGLPHTVRQGSTVVISVGSLRPIISGNPGSGYIEVFLDGVPVDIAPIGSTVHDGDARRARVTGAATPSVMFQLPPGTPTGTREVSVRYSGDAFFQPAQVNAPLTVLAGTGTVYECRGTGTPPMRFRASIVAQGNLPRSAPAGVDIPVDHLTVRLLTDRSQNTTNAFSGLLGDGVTTEVGSPNLNAVGFDFGPAGEGSATGVARSFGARLPNTPNPATDVDQVIDPVGEAGTVSLGGEIGDVVTVTLDAVRIDMVETIVGITFNLVCTPVGDPIELGQVRISGVDLAVAPVGSSRQGDDVELTATVGDPAALGVMEFRDGTTTIGMVPVNGPTVTFTTDDLVVGERSLDARFFPQSIGPVQVSAPVVHRVLPEFDCPAFASAGSGAVVRLVYLELLGRCPDRAGFDHWVGQLDAGTSVEAFAQAIARTSEAVGRVVDDAYVTMLGRRADAAGRAFWTSRLQASGRYDSLLADLASSSEFWSLAGSTDQGFVTRVYDRLLGRSPDSAGLAYWTERLGSGASHRGLVVSLANLDEPLGRLVAASYATLLDRPPFAGERLAGIRSLRATGDRSGLQAELIGRPEFSTRSQGFPNRR